MSDWITYHKTAQTSHWTVRHRSRWTKNHMSHWTLEPILNCEWHVTVEPSWYLQLWATTQSRLGLWVLHVDRATQ